MKFFSTAGKSKPVTFREAVLYGMADDGGLYMPEHIVPLDAELITKLPDLGIRDMARSILRPYCTAVLDDGTFDDIIEEVFTFDSPLVALGDDLYVLELFHGPTLAFKDFGARFMARTLSEFAARENRELTILAATSGDTGSAVASAFHKRPGIRVVLLYPSGMVSEIQEKQLTTQGANVTALEVTGTFDDCQRLVKTAFLDDELKMHRPLSSANSINIARLLPQMLYYFSAFGQLGGAQVPVFSVPSGNLGNLTAGLLASESGLPVRHFIAALNANDSFKRYLTTGRYEAGRTIATLSNAMDVGDPSNIRRIFSLYDSDAETIGKFVYSDSFSDERTLEAIREIHGKYGYVMDPHGAVAYLAAMEYRRSTGSGVPTVLLETAHPAKFKGTVDAALNLDVELPDALKACMEQEKKSEKISPDYDEFRAFLWKGV